MFWRAFLSRTKVSYGVEITAKFSDHRYDLEVKCLGYIYMAHNERIQLPVSFFYAFKFSAMITYDLGVKSKGQIC